VSLRDLTGYGCTKKLDSGAAAASTTIADYSGKMVPLESSAS
jgi:hypothetical protein